MDDNKPWWWQAAEEILAALSDRQGIGDEIDAVRDDIRAEIVEEIADIIMAAHVAHDAA